ncbi:MULTISPECIES: hypothetical protein [unclassified Mesorhizobium]|uniref:hypothetical protein n=1 Tax=unclassified Mesorhizobium TaxID=325217 RepID=UPI00143F4FAB|nr:MULTISPECIES: hypothetical protein [unclassified Mesorhizobium]
MQRKPDENENAAAARPGGVEFHSMRRQSDAVRKTGVSSDEAEASGSHGAGLAGHGLGETLTLESGRQVHFAAGEQAGKELHHHLHLVAQTGRLRLMEWGSSLAGSDIGLLWRKLNRKSEALDMKSDINCDIFGQDARNLRLFTMN